MRTINRICWREAFKIKCTEIVSSSLAARIWDLRNRDENSWSSQALIVVPSLFSSVMIKRTRQAKYTQAPFQPDLSPSSNSSLNLNLYRRVISVETHPSLILSAGRSMVLLVDRFTHHELVINTRSRSKYFIGLQLPSHPLSVLLQSP